MKALGLLRSGAGSLVGLIQKYVALLAFVAGASIVAVIWWNTPNCEQKVAVDALALEKSAREKAEILATGHAAEVLMLRTENINLRRRIRDHVQDIPGCRLSGPAVKLLNRARSGLPESSSGIDEGAGAITANHTGSSPDT